MQVEMQVRAGEEFCCIKPAMFVWLTGVRWYNTTPAVSLVLV